MGWEGLGAGAPGFFGLGPRLTNLGRFALPLEAVWALVRDFCHL